MIEFKAAILSTTPLSVRAPAMYDGELSAMAERYDEVVIRVSAPHKPRTTGYRSENSHTHGHYADIAEQLSNDDVTYTPDEIGRALKIMAMKEGFWEAKKDVFGGAVMNPITKALEPMSEADSSTAQSAKLIEYIHYWAAMNQLWLTEYVQGVATKMYSSDINLREENDGKH
jgi:hypothetical protein